MNTFLYEVAVFAALGWERRAVTDALAGVVPGDTPRTWRGHLADGATCLVVQTGIGFDRARGAAAAAPPVRRMVACGCAGALVESLRAGDLVAADGVVPLDAAGRAGTPLPAECTPLAAWAAAAGFRLHPGTFASSTAALASAAAKATAAASGAVVVEMESAAIADVARSRRVPFVGLRVVLDEARDELPVVPNLVDADSGEIRAAGAAGLVLRPRLWPVLVRLARKQRVAEVRLRALLAALAAAGVAPFESGATPRAGSHA